MFKDILSKAMENEKRLGSCKVHDFSIDVTPEKVMGKRWKCSKCLGETDNISKYWYNKGLEHGNDREFVKHWYNKGLEHGGNKE